MMNFSLSLFASSSYLRHHLLCYIDIFFVQKEAIFFKENVMGSLFSQIQDPKHRQGRRPSGSAGGGSSSHSHEARKSFPPVRGASGERLRQNHMEAKDKPASRGKLSSGPKSKYAFIPDNYSSIEQVTEALRHAGLESSNLILGIDFTKSNEWTGKRSFNGKNLHAIGDAPNPYEKAISIIGKTLAPFDEDNLIPCFGFGDVTTHDQLVFSFHSDHSPCHGFEEALACYRKIVPHLRLSGPTSYAPVIEAAIDIVERSGGQYHVLIIIADGQVTRSVDISDDDLSPQEEKTIKAIVGSSSYPLSIVLVGVGDGPWDDMKRFDDKIPACGVDNFQFVNFTSIMTRDSSPSQKETAFALAALMEIPIQYRACLELKMLGQTTGRARQIVPRPPPVPVSHRAPLERPPSNNASNPSEDGDQVCAICLTNRKDLAFGCGHLTCRECGSRVSSCPICRQPITSRLRLFT